jgi:hypothetical protein
LTHPRRPVYDLTVNRRGFCAAGMAALVRLHAAEAPARPRVIAADRNTRDLRYSQLFLDDTWIEDTTRLKRMWNSAEILPEPVLRPEAPWEGTQIVMYGSVFKLNDEWRMYYGTYNPPQPSLFCLATSDDGIHWVRPKLNLVNFRGSKANNILWAPEAGEKQDCPTVCHDPQDLAAPFKMMYYASHGSQTAGEYVAFSKDGIVWKPQALPVLTNTGDRTNLMGTRDRAGKFVAYLRHRDMMKLYGARCVWRSESSDFLKWTDPELILRQDLLDDPNTELYGMTGFPYADLYLGMVERWRDNPDVIEVQLAWSHDGKQWQRPLERSTFISASFPWNKAWNTCASNAPIQLGNELLIYFGGRSGAHGKEFPRSYGAIGLATIVADRFAAIQADFVEGRLITRSMRWPGGDLVLNCSNTRYPESHPNSKGGSIRVEIWDADQRPIPEFSGENGAEHNVISPQSGQSKPRPVRWRGDRSLREMTGRTIRPVFFLRDARLFSFRAV